MTDKIRVSFVGCCLVDRLYSNISFSDSIFSPYLSKKRADGGLTPGHLVFKEEFEEFKKMEFQEILRQITKGEKSDKINIGGPGIVPLIHTSQMLEIAGCECRFYGCGGKDADGEFILSTLKQMNLPVENYHLSGNCTPSTVVLSDPSFDDGHGERVFINSIGAAWDYGPNNLEESFFDSQLVVFGGTALVPQIHDHLTELLQKAKSKGCITVVNTVFDFRNEKVNPNKRWPLGKSDESYKNIDLLLVDQEEAFRLSGETDMGKAMFFFKNKGCAAIMVTNGSKNIRLFSDGKVFKELTEREMPVSRFIVEKLKKGNKGDTTGCGDNFVGGVLASIVEQLQRGDAHPDLIEAVSWGIVSGGFSCTYIGGTYFEKELGEKRKLINLLYDQYQTQCGVEPESRSIVIFGAGKIGRSFIGQLFSRSGYEVVFLDVDTQLVHALNQKKEYNVIIKEQRKETLLQVSNVRAVAVKDQKEVIQEIAHSSLLAVSVGKSAFPQVLPLIGEGIRERYRLFPDRPIDIIIAENFRTATQIIKPQLRAILGDDFPLEKLVGLVETSIGKMVPLMTPVDLKEDPLQVFAESYNDLILDKHGFKGAVPVVEGLCPKDNIKAWVDRKAFIHNMGHATVAYAGAFYYPDAQFIYEVLSDGNIFSFARTVMQQAARVLLDYYPNDFTLKGLEFHIDDLLFRFQNKALKDTIFRVGRDLPRKLSATDRFAGVIRMARKRDLAYNFIIEAMTYGFFFKKTNEEGELSDPDKRFIQSLSRGVDNALVLLCGFDPREDQNFIDELNEQYVKLNQIELRK